MPNAEGKEVWKDKDWFAGGLDALEQPREVRLSNQVCNVRGDSICLPSSATITALLQRHSG